MAYTCIRYQKESGAALVVVLSILVLLTAVMVAFMSSSKNALEATVQYSTGQEAHALAETATNLVMGQIREATLSGIDNSGRGRYTWASQPGALRVWDDDGRFVQLYKLYSAAQMKESNMSFLNAEIPNDWRDHKDAYVDLNEPVFKGTQWHYPILNPAALGIVDGFSSDQTQVSDASIHWDTRTSMPVRWLYINRDGEISSALQPNSVGRIAFWTDDETSKVNVNTASFTQVSRGAAPAAQNISSSYWDTPSTRLAQDYAMGRSMPIQDEFQRYPGHPASVNIGSIMKLDSTFTLQNAFSLVPRYKWGGSQNGTRSWTDAPDIFNPVGSRIGGQYRKMERLYASVDEIYFKEDRQEQEHYPSVAGLGKEESTDMYRFFLTTSSRAPDLNLFGTPRVSLWPLHLETDSLHRTIFDKLIAQCTTVGSYIYYFQRYDPLSQTNDWLGISRNRALFAYLQNATSEKIPGFGGGNFATKYNAGASGEWNQILTEMFDYIRCVNLNETYSNVPAGFKSYTPMLRRTDWVAGDTEDQLNASWVNADDHAGAGFVLPIRIDSLGTRGMGRVPTLSELGFLLLADPSSPSNPNPPLYSWLLMEQGSPMMGYMPWMPPKNFSISVKGTESTVIVEGEPRELPLGFMQNDPDHPAFVFQPLYPNITTKQEIIDSFSNPFSGSHSVGGTVGIAWPTLTGRLNSNAGGAKIDGKPYPFYLARDQGKAFSGDHVDVTGGTLTVEYGIDGNVFQTFEVELPPTTVPKPIGAVVQRIAFNSGVGGIRWDDVEGTEDVVRSVLLKDGDIRVSACLQDVPKGFFEPHKDYNDANKRLAHSFIRRVEYAQNGATFGTLVGNITNYPEDPTSLSAGWYENYRPDINPTIQDLRGRGWTGDWSTGVGRLRDGPHVIKSDEGFARGGKQPNYFNEYYWSAATGFFSPTRQIPSAVLFGTLPTGVKRTANAYASGGTSSDAAPWRTLLFCPNPDAGPAHFGFQNPPDYLLLDLFNMPVVEPYAISEPLSTAGRINMNSQILPFTDIRRDSGLYAVLSSQKVTALSPVLVDSYKTRETPTDGSSSPSRTYRYRIQIEETLKQFHERFAPNNKAADGDLFRSAAEICAIFLVPNLYTQPESGAEGTHPNQPRLNASDIIWSGTHLTVPKMTTWWQDYRLTGDNLRERPYATIYPLLTTKSNTYTVHMISQTLAPGTHQVTGEYRGSTTIERYIDPADSRIGTEINPDTESLEPLYRFRVVDTKRFAP